MKAMQPYCIGNAFMTFPDIFLPDATYDALTVDLTNTLRLDHDSAETLRLALAATLDASTPGKSPAGLTGGVLGPSRYGSLIEALATLEPFLGAEIIVAHQVVDALSDAGIWPDCVLEDQAEANTSKISDNAFFMLSPMLVSVTHTPTPTGD
jgi:hypothetical protein